MWRFLFGTGWALGLAFAKEPAGWHFRFEICIIILTRHAIMILAIKSRTSV